MGPRRKKAFEIFTTANELACSLYSDDVYIKYAAQQAMTRIGHVASHYLDWFYSIDYFNSRLDDILFFGFQETLEDDFRKLKIILSLPDEIKLPSDNKVSHKTSPQYSTKLNDIAIANLKKWYARDIEFYNYCAKIYQERWGHF